MKILISGSSGLVGSAITAAFIADGHEVTRLVRREPNTAACITEQFWDPSQDSLNSKILEPIDAAIHLGGVPIAGSRWSRKRKLLIRGSRIRSTRLLSQTLATIQSPPKIFLVASGIGCYGNRGDEILTENSPAGEGFLADTARHWEGAADAARDAGIRVVHARFGLIMSRDGGLLSKMKIPFKAGLGGTLGDGKQWWPWISLEDVINAIRHIIDREELYGAVNVTARNPVRNKEFTKSLSSVLARPAWFNIPAPLIKLLFGEMGIETMLSSQRVYPEKLTTSGFNWRSNSLKLTMRQELTNKL